MKMASSDVSETDSIVIRRPAAILNPSASIVFYPADRMFLLKFVSNFILLIIINGIIQFKCFFVNNFSRSSICWMLCLTIFKRLDNVVYKLPKKVS